MMGDQHSNVLWCISVTNMLSWTLSTRYWCFAASQVLSPVGFDGAGLLVLHATTRVGRCARGPSRHPEITVLV
jgi:hypothetical protein